MVWYGYMVCTYVRESEGESESETHAHAHTHRHPHTYTHKHTRTNTQNPPSSHKTLSFGIIKRYIRTYTHTYKHQNTETHSLSNNFHNFREVILLQYSTEVLLWPCLVLLEGLNESFPLLHCGAHNTPPRFRLGCFLLYRVCVPAATAHQQRQVDCRIPSTLMLRYTYIRIYTVE